MSRRDREPGGLVYSTGQGEMCPRCRAPRAQCRCDAVAAPAAGGIVRVGRETRGRKGAGVTVISGVPLAGTELADLASRLKRRCGSGGTVKDGVIEIQGDHRDTVIRELAPRGWTIRRAGG